MMMDDQAPPPPAAPVIIQQAPSQQQTALDSTKGSVDAMNYAVDSGALQKYAQAQTDIQKAQAPQIAQNYLDQQRTYGPQLTQLAMDNLKMADPSGFAIRQQYGQQVKDNLERKGALSDDETRNLQQDVRAGQDARGVGTGFSDAIDEARYLGQNRYNREQQALANSASFLAGQTPQASFASLNQAGKTAPVGSQDVSGAAASLFPSTNALIGNQAQNYGTYAGAMGQLNNYNLGVANYTQQYSSNPFLEGLGVATQLAGTLSSAAMCWVAEELYGRSSIRTHAIRKFLTAHIGEDSALGRFVQRYMEEGREWAKEIEENAMLRAKAQVFYDELLEMAN